MKSQKKKIEITDKFYICDGKKYDRVSNFTGGDFFDSKAAREAMNRGKTIHKYIDLIHSGKFTPIAMRGVVAENPEMHKILLSYMHLKNKIKMKIHFSEKSFLSNKYMIGGTPDLFADIAGKKNVLIDLKTGNFYKSYLLQIGGGYDIILRENGIEPEHYAIIFLRSGVSSVVFLNPADIQAGRTAFLGFLNYKRGLNLIKNYSDRG